MEKNKYAIIIVTYNRIELLKECINNAVNQTIPAESIIIINNASTDGTKEYLDKLKDNTILDIHNLDENIGGAGGFCIGIEAALKKDVESILIIDDDAMISRNYMELLLKAKTQNPTYKAFAGAVVVDGVIDTFHRKNLSKVGFFQRTINAETYKSDNFECEIASFCGMLVDTSIVKKIGLPHSHYFIWYDDTEYSLRIRKHTKFLVVTDAILNHKTKLNTTHKPRRYDWREYYAVRNRILMIKEHGTLLDRLVNNIDLFVRVVFRNWLFGLIKKSGYDWKYEKDIVNQAIKNAKRNNTINIIMQRKE